jgi:serine/threonine protein kinase
MEYAPGGTLFDYVDEQGGLAELEARWFFRQLVTGLNYCHSQGGWWPLQPPSGGAWRGPGWCGWRVTDWAG